MNEIIFKYFFLSDILYIQLEDEKSPIGDDDYKDDVILFRSLKSGKVIGIEIPHFREFKDDKIQLSPKREIDVTIPFRFIKAFVSLEDIRETEPEEFIRIMKIWGYSLTKFDQEKVDLPFDRSLAPIKAFG